MECPPGLAEPAGCTRHPRLGMLMENRRVVRLSTVVKGGLEDAQLGRSQRMPQDSRPDRVAGSTHVNRRSTLQREGTWKSRDSTSRRVNDHLGRHIHWKETQRLKERRATTRSRWIDSLGGVGAGSRRGEKEGRRAPAGRWCWRSSAAFHFPPGAVHRPAALLLSWALPGLGSSTLVKPSARRSPRTSALHASTARAPDA